LPDCAPPFISIVIPVKNGARRLECCLDSLARQRYPRDRVEVIVADGRSIDATRAVAESRGARVVDNPRELVAAGRNVGFKHVQGQIVAFTDDDCTFPEDWLERAAMHFTDADIAGLGGPTRMPADESSFGRAVSFLFEIGVRAAGSVHAEKVAAKRAVSDLPGCNMFYRREALERVMPVIETLVTAEDVELGFRLREAGFRLFTVPDVSVWHHKRPTPRRFFRQMYRFAIGRLQVGRRHAGALKPAHIAVGLALPATVLLLPISAVGLPMLSLMLFATAMVRTGAPGVALRVPIVVIGGAFAWSAGFMRELVSPLPTNERGFDWSSHAG
jgi:succinoglycan biosynthesis protein ExoA